MDQNEKLLRKLDKKRRAQLQEILVALLAGQLQGLNITKLGGSDKFRLRKGWFRIIFHYENNLPVIDSLKLRNEKTYKGL